MVQGLSEQGQVQVRRERQRRQKHPLPQGGALLKISSNAEAFRYAKMDPVSTQDAAAAMLVYEKALAAGIGTRVDI